MTQSEIAALPDDELISMTAEKVMGWRDRSGAYMVIPVPQTWSGWYRTGTNEEQGKCWDPLANWNHTMQVVTAMRAKGWHYERLQPDDENGIWVGFVSGHKVHRGLHGRRVFDYDNEQRAILQAALAAMEGSK